MNIPYDGYYYGHSIPGLIKDIFLAVSPLIILYVYKWSAVNARWAKKPTTALFVLFLPNALYLATEPRHLYISGDRVAETFSWEATIVFYMIGLIGLLLLLEAIVRSVRVMVFFNLEQKFAVWALSLATAYGAGMGMFERINSYDVFLRPLKAVRGAFNLLFSENIPHVLWIGLLLGVLATYLHIKEERKKMPVEIRY